MHWYTMMRVAPAANVRVSLERSRCAEFGEQPQLQERVSAGVFNEIAQGVIVLRAAAAFDESRIFARTLMPLILGRC